MPTFVPLPVITPDDKTKVDATIPRMELRHLRYFCSVAEHKSFTIAARLLNVSQSGVSGQVQALEREIGVTLLRRNQREVALTPEGAAFWEQAREILVRADQAVDLAIKASRGESGRLIVGLCGPVTAQFLPKLIRTFRKRYPGVELALKDRPPSHQVQALLNNEIDIAFTRSIPVNSKHLLKYEVLFREPVIAAVPKDHELANDAAIPLRKLAHEKLIVCARDGAPEIFDPIITMCKKAHFSPKLGETPDSWASVLTMVEAGEGIALVPACVQHLRANQVVFRSLRQGGCRLDAIVAWRHNEASAVQESFLCMLRERQQDSVGSPAKKPAAGFRQTA